MGECFVIGGFSSLRGECASLAKVYCRSGNRPVALGALVFDHGTLVPLLLDKVAETTTTPEAISTTIARGRIQRNLQFPKSAGVKERGMPALL